MGLFDFLKPKPKAPTPEKPFATPEELAQVCYGLAYYVLPNFAHREFDQFLRIWRTPFPPLGTMLCEFACSKQNLRSTPEQAAAFKMQDGQLTSSCDYYLVQFPSPPPFAGIDFDNLESVLSSGGRPPVLAPFFAAVLDNRASGHRRFYVLGQSPTGGTTFRSVTADGSNCNHGPGPEPTSFAFLERLKQETVG